MSDGSVGEIDLKYPPDGVRCRQAESGLTVSATTRSSVGCLITPFITAWAQVVVYILYRDLIVEGKFSQYPLFYLVYSIICIFAGIPSVMYAMMLVCGKVEIRTRGDDVEIFEGVWLVGITDRFKLSEIESVGYFDKPRRDGKKTTHIAIKGRQEFLFGSLLSERRMNYMHDILMQIVRK